MRNSAIDKKKYIYDFSQIFHSPQDFPDSANFRKQQVES